ncbi:YhgE/Pip domain-containing protein [Lentilactobacillus sp. SPB1-3]|uniref:YhgE/Pip family protein n=1 Tax=Lentilactobacillus terminaliae TaxID=3003483 RepID=A0ACD5DEB8_9LACO|nr:YhgE/Pip domain-containing protein [Lentilactobacillus sp. SPB1-3]MCZ0977500.1 YhgE/Pip domain-containing protein [Lentilactobacillus sp. SPB1-3]
MSTIFKLLKKDISKIIHSKPVLITIMAFCLVPASYALLNIKASWNPYSTENIRRLPIAVVNDDEGSSINGKNMNIGKQIIGQLKKNHDVKWVITDDWDGNNGLDQGKYYAMIEIPSDFSDRLGSLASDAPQKPTVVYKSNEKLNPAATKITSQAKDTLTEQIRSSFTQLSGRMILKQLNKTGIDVSANKSRILGIRDSLNDSMATIRKADNQLKRVNKNSQDVKNYLATVKNGIPRVSSQINDLSNVLTQQQNLLNTAKNNADATKNSVNNALNSVQSSTDSLQSNVSSLNADSSPSLIRSQVAATKTAGNTLINALNDGIRVFDVVNSIIPNSQANRLVIDFTNAKKSIKQQQRYLDQVSAKSTSRSSVSKLLKRINQLNEQIQNNLTSAAASASSATDSLDAVGDAADGNSSRNAELIASLKEIIPELKALQSAGSSISSLSINQVNSISTKLNDIKAQLNGLDQQLSFINNKNLNKLIGLLETSPDVSNILATPIKLQTKELYNMGVFGYGATPFYTVLSIWIGILLLTTVVAWRYPAGKTMRENKIYYYQTYGGKFLLYLSIAFTQTLITLIGEILWLGIRPRSLLAFMGIDFFTAFVFTMIIFSLVFSFGNVGKVFAVLLMILQIFGTGGLYPLEVIPNGLTNFAKFLPFTYAVSAFRESIAGPDWEIYFHDLWILFLMGIILVIFTPLMRRLFRKPIHELEVGVEKSEL